MSRGDEGFLGRWSRHKTEARARKVEARAREVEPGAACDTPEADVFDPESLPPVESLGVDSDYTAFLARGVPKALRNAALRRAWVTDPAIRNHRTPAEYDWDCNAPGYGRLWSCDDPRRLVEAMFRHLRPEAEAEPEDSAAAEEGGKDESAPPEPS
jgi:hypothetical protein